MTYIELGCNSANMVFKIIFKISLFTKNGSASCYSLYNNSLAGSSYKKLPKKLDHPRKGLTNFQNIDDNYCFKWSLVRYLNPANYHPARITKADKDFAKILDFKDIKLPVKIRDIRNIEKKNFISISVFGYENKEKHPIYVSKNCCGKAC